LRLEFLLQKLKPLKILGGQKHKVEWPFQVEEHRDVDRVKVPKFLNEPVSNH
jgi:hypothetical protein